MVKNDDATKKSEDWMNSAKAKRILKTINFTILSVILIFSITLVISCKNSPQTADITGSKDSKTNQTVTEPEDSEAADLDQIKTLVESFGKVLANVSLLSPSDILESDIKKHYGPFLSEGLISKWIRDPLTALGRLTSSPWPDRIEITDIKKITADNYEIFGNVVEITSAEAEEGSYSNKFGIRLTVERFDGNWVITEAVKDDNSSNADSASQDAIMKDFEELLISQARSYQVILFIDQNINKMSSQNADIILEKLEYIQKNDKQFYTDMLFEDDWQAMLNDIFNNDIEIKDIHEITDEQLKKIAEEIFGGGFKLIALEGSFYPFIDYEFLKKYSPYLSQQFGDYLNIMAVESNKIFSRDAALAISWDELAFRLINCEGFLISYPEDTVRKKEVGDLYMKYLVSYYLGQNNTPSFSYDNNAIKPDVLDSYNKLVSQYPDNITTDITKKYQAILEGSNYIVNDSVYAKLDELYKEAVLSFGLDARALLLESSKNTYYQTPLTENGYAILVNGKFNENDVTIRLSDFTSFEDFDADGINDAAVILMAEKPDSTITYSLALNINKYFYFKNIPDIIIGDSSELEILSLEIKENKIFLTSISNQIEKSRVFGVKDDQLFEY
ncbi:MAG: hypothetical protein ACYCXK_10375 [Candidatus Humimicrobiaceae bacterium]